MFVMSLWVVVISLSVSVRMAASHSDVDPEILEISEELANEPDNAALLLQRGQLYRFNGKFTESLSDLEQAWLLDPENAQVTLELCRTLMALGRELEAEIALNQHLGSQAGLGRVVALGLRAEVLARTGRADLAVVDFTEALSLYPTIELYLARGHLQERLGKLEAAAAGYLEGLSQLPRSNILRQKLIKVLMSQAQYPKALNLIDEELASASVKTEWYLQRAKVLAALGQMTAMTQARLNALAEANRVFAKRPTILNRFVRARVYHALGQIEAAKQDLRVAIQAAPKFYDAQDLLNKLQGQ